MTGPRNSTNQRVAGRAVDRTCQGKHGPRSAQPAAAAIQMYPGQNSIQASGQQAHPLQRRRPAGKPRGTFRGPSLYLIVRNRKSGRAAGQNANGQNFRLGHLSLQRRRLATKHGPSHANGHMVPLVRQFGRAVKLFSRQQQLSRPKQSIKRLSLKRD